jgi:hypothetical protein
MALLTSISDRYKRDIPNFEMVARVLGSVGSRSPDNAILATSILHLVMMI